jgi:hypothetical protein
MMRMKVKIQNSTENAKKIKKRKVRKKIKNNSKREPEMRCPATESVQSLNKHMRMQREKE